MNSQTESSLLLLYISNGSINNPKIRSAKFLAEEHNHLVINTHFANNTFGINNFKFFDILTKSVFFSIFLLPLPS